MSATDSPRLSAEQVRIDMRRKLSPAEQACYRGITFAGASGQKYQKLYGIDTAEDLIIAEVYGARFIPSDHQNECYLLSAERGLTASYSAAMKESIIASRGSLGHISDKTLDELHNEYLHMPRPATDEDKRSLEEDLNACAVAFAAWMNARRSEIDI